MNNLQGSINGSRMDIEKKSHDGEICHPHGGKHVDPRGKLLTTSFFMASFLHLMDPVDI